MLTYIVEGTQKEKLSAVYANTTTVAKGNNKNKNEGHGYKEEGIMSK